LIDAIEDQGIEVESFTFDPETGELSYVVKIVNYAGSGSQSLENTIEGALEQEGIEKDDVTHGTSKTTSEDTVVQNLIDAIEELNGTGHLHLGALRARPAIRPPRASAPASSRRP
jgi:hypothetical protein